MDAHQKKRLEAYLRNSRRFLWGLSPGNQGTVYDWLEHTMHVQFTRGNYDSVTTQLIKNRDLGIENLIRNIVIPTVTVVFPKNTIASLRDSWEQKGHPPDLDTLRSLRINMKVTKKDAGIENSQIWLPFVEINTLYKHKYVERWGELASIWYEEIEPYLQGTE